MDTTKEGVEMYEMGKVVMDVEDVTGDAKDDKKTGRDDKPEQDECIISIHCPGSCARSGGEVGQEDHLEQDDRDECILTIHCLGGCSQDEGPTAGTFRSHTTQESGMPEEATLIEPNSGQVGGIAGSMEMMVGSGRGGREDTG